MWVTRRNPYITRERLHSNKMDLTFYQDRPDVMVNRITYNNRPYIKYYLGTQCNVGYSMGEQDCLSINIMFNLSWQNRRRSPVGPMAKSRSSTMGNLQEERQPAEAHTKVKCKDSRMTHSMLGHQAITRSLASR